MVVQLSKLTMPKNHKSDIPFLTDRRGWWPSLAR